MPTPRWGYKIPHFTSSNTADCAIIQKVAIDGSGNYIYSNSEVNSMLDTLMNGNGLWEVDAATLTLMADDIDSRFSL